MRERVKVYFDETNHTGNIGIALKGDKLSYSNFDEYYNFIFIGFYNESNVRKEVRKLEKKHFPNSIGEIKGSSLMKRDLFSVPTKNILFYLEIFDLVIKNKRIFQFGSYNRIELIVRKGLINENYLMEYLGRNFNIFIANLSKYINDQCAYRFFNFTSRNKNKRTIFLFLSNTLGESIEFLINKPNMKQLVQNFIDMKNILENLWRFVEPDESVGENFNKWSYDLLCFSLDEISNEMKVIPSVLVDNHDKTLDTIRKSFNAKAISSKEEPLSRIPDYILSFFRRVVRTVNKTHDQKRKISKDFISKTVYKEELFIFDKKPELLKLLKKAFKIFDHEIKWETFYGYLKTEMITLIEYLRLANSGEVMTSEKLNCAVTSGLL